MIKISEIDFKIKIVGVEPFKHSYVKGKALVECQTDFPLIILSHSQVDFSNKNTQVLVLCGDTHRGQIFMPKFFLGKIFWKPERHGSAW